MFENFRERLTMVQQDLTSGFKNRGDKSRDGNTKRTQRFEEKDHCFSGGLEILNRYEESWFLLHRRTRDCAQAAEEVDGDIVMLSAHWERRRITLTQLQEQLQSLPAFICELDAVTTNIAHLEGEFEEMESRLMYLENLCSQCEQQTVKQQHINQIEAYKNKKRKELESLQVELTSEHAQKLAELEHVTQQKLKERQKVYEQAFKKDMDQYLSTGFLQSQDPTEACDSALDQMTVTNLSDQEALDDFLNSSGDDMSAESSLTSGPDQSLSPTPLTNSPHSHWDAEWQQTAEAESEESDEPVVQSDEESVQADTKLFDLKDPTKLKGSDDSDSMGE